MKTIYYPIILLFLTISVATAQNNNTTVSQENDSGWTRFINKMELSKWKPGIKIGINFNKFTSANAYKYRTGYNFGLFADYTGKWFVFQPGINYFSKGTRIILEYPRYKDEPLITKSAIRYNFLEIPLRFGVTIFHHHIGCAQPVRLNATPYFAYALNAKYASKYDVTKMNLGKGENELPRLDYGIKIGISAAFGTFEPSFGYDFGLNNIANRADSSNKNRGFYFTFAMVFGK
jgi:hypothetical protein